MLLKNNLRGTASLTEELLYLLIMKVNRCFRGTYHLHLQGRKISQSKITSLKVSGKQKADGGDMFL
jgi:hypothetical protein